MPIQKITSEELEALQEEQPHAYEEILRLRDYKARLWNALVWYGGSDLKKFRGRLWALAQDLAAEAKAEHWEETGEDPTESEYKTQMDYVAAQMTKDGWRNCHSF